MKRQLAEEEGLAWDEKVIQPFNETQIEEAVEVDDKHSHPALHRPPTSSRSR